MPNYEAAHKSPAKQTASQPSTVSRAAKPRPLAPAVAHLSRNQRIKSKLAVKDHGFFVQSVADDF